MNYKSFAARLDAEQPTFTDVAAYSKNGNNPDDHKAKSRFSPSCCGENELMNFEHDPNQPTHAKYSQYMCVHFQSSLMHTSWESGI